jgi:Arc/MetJ-type ribon-helix-helix transcriptional regulator
MTRSLGMMIGMTRSKIAVSLPAELVAAARQAVSDGRAASVSGYVESALRTQVEQDDLQRWVDGLLESSGGPMTEAERARLDDLLGW